MKRWAIFMKNNGMCICWLIIWTILDVINWVCTLCKLRHARWEMNQSAMRQCFEIFLFSLLYRFRDQTVAHGPDSVRDCIVWFSIIFMWLLFGWIIFGCSCDTEKKVELRVTLEVWSVHSLKRSMGCFYCDIKVLILIKKLYLLYKF